MTTTIVFGDPSDGQISSSHSSYNTARAGSGLSANTSDTTLYAGQYSFLDNGCVEGFVAFNLAAASIPPGDTIIDADLVLHQSSGQGTGFDIEAREYDWGASLTTADWVAGANLGTLDLLATLTASTASNATRTFTPSGTELIDHVEAHRAGVSRMLLNSSRHRLGNAPFGFEITIFTSADNSGTTNDPRLVIEHEAGPEEYDADGTLGLTLGISGTARKVSRSSGALALNLAASDDAAKTGQTEATIDTELTVDGTTVKTGAVSGTVALTAAVEAAAIAAKLTDTTLDLDLSINGSTSKAAQVAAALDLALDLAADTHKATAVAAALGLTLDIAGTAVRHEAGQVSGTIALALAIAATAIKHVEATGQAALALDITGTATKTGRTASDLGLDLDITGTAHPITADHPTGRVDITLGITGTARKSATTIGTLDLLLAIVGRIGTDWVLDPCRTLTVESEHRVLVVPAEPRIFHVAHENRTLLVTC